MKRLLLVANSSKDHVRKFHIPFLQRLQENGWQVEVACFMDEPIPEADKTHNLPFHRNPFRGGLFKSVGVLKGILRQNHYDVLLCNTVVGAVVARLAAASFRKKGLKVVYLNHGLHFFPGASASRWMLGYPMEKWLAPRTDAIITINRVDFGMVKKHLKGPVVEKCSGMGVCLERFRNATLSPQERGAQRAALGIGEDAFVLAYVAEITGVKNQKLLLDAFVHLRRGIPNCKLMLIGPEYDGGKLRKTVQHRGLQEEVLLLGWRDDVPELLHLADVYVASSKSEGLGLNLVEAMACDLPVVATKNRGHAELICHGENGFLVELDDSRGMAEHVLWLCENAQERGRITRQAQQTIEAFKSETATEKLLEITERYANK